jgi:hypothetical protein
MSVQLNRLTNSMFSNEEAILFANKSIPVYREAFGDEPFLQGVTVDAQERNVSLRDILNRTFSSEYTTTVRSSDAGREDGMVAVKDQLSSNIRRMKKQPLLASNSAKLLAIIDKKCPDFQRANDTQQTVMLDALKSELSLPENVLMIETVGVKEIVNELFEHNEEFKTSQNQRTSGNAKETPKRKENRASLVKVVSLMHLCLDYLLEKKPAAMAPFAEKINAINSEIMTGVHARTTREQNSADAKTIEKETGETVGAA